MKNENRKGGGERRLMHLVPAPAVKLMKSRVLSRPGVKSKNKHSPGASFSKHSLAVCCMYLTDQILGFFIFILKAWCLTPKDKIFIKQYCTRKKRQLHGILNASWKICSLVVNGQSAQELLWKDSVGTSMSAHLVKFFSKLLEKWMLMMSRQLCGALGN